MKLNILPTKLPGIGKHSEQKCVKLVVAIYATAIVESQTQGDQTFGQCWQFPSLFAGRNKYHKSFSQSLVLFITRSNLSHHLLSVSFPCVEVGCRWWGCWFEVLLLTIFLSSNSILGLRAIFGGGGGGGAKGDRRLSVSTCCWRK